MGWLGGALATGITPLDLLNAKRAKVHEQWRDDREISAEEHQRVMAMSINAVWVRTRVLKCIPMIDRATIEYGKLVEWDWSIGHWGDISGIE
eukprot:1185901-Prorocentrum_minimum.AAC.11